MEQIDLYQLHAPDPSVPFEESVGALADLQRAGKIRWMGLSNVSVDQIRGAEALAPVATVQNRLNPFFREALTDGVVRYCGERGIGFLAYSPTGGGRLTLKLPAHPLLADLARRLGVQPMRSAWPGCWRRARRCSPFPAPGGSSMPGTAPGPGCCTSRRPSSQPSPPPTSIGPEARPPPPESRARPGYIPAMPCAPRRQTVTAHVGDVAVGSAHPIVVQSMTNTDTADVPGTVRQVAALARAGSELVRVTVNNEAAARAVAPIVEGLDREGIAVPIIGDFHYNGHLLLTRYPDARAPSPSTGSTPATSGASGRTRISAPSSRWRWRTTSRCGSASTGARWTSSS